MDSEENAEESTTTDGASQLEQIREIVKKAIAEMREAGLLAYSQGGFRDGGDFEVHLWRNDAAKSLHGGPYVVTIKGSNRNQSKEQSSDSARKGRIDLTELEEQFKDGLNWDDMNTMNLIAELKKCYEIIDIYQSTGEDFDTQIAFHEKGLCEYLKHPCGPCEGEDNTEQQMEEAQRKREYGYSRPSVDDYDPMYDDPNFEEPWEE